MHLQAIDYYTNIRKIIDIVKDLEHGVHPKLDKISIDNKQAFFILKYQKAGTYLFMTTIIHNQIMLFQ